LFVVLMKKSFRKRKAESDEESDKEVGEEDTEILKRIKQQTEEARKRQKLRAKQVIQAGVVKEKEEKPEEEEKYGLQERDPFGGQFTESSTAAFSVEHEDKMNQFIERKLEERRGRQKDVDAKAPEGSTQYRSIDERALEDHGHEDMTLTTDPIEDANRWLTGIQEVQLPIEYKIRNIEDTEEARKKAMLAARRGEDESGNAGKSGHHKRFVLGQQIRGIAQIADQTKATTEKDQPGRPKTKSSDEAVYAQYVNRFLDNVKQKAPTKK